MMKTNILVYSIFILLCCNFAFSADPTLTFASPKEAGISESILKEGVVLFEEAVAKDELRSVVILVARKGKIVLHEALGWKDWEQNIPLQKEALFRMASNTKPVIATGISILVEDRKLNYTDLIRKHIRSFDDYRSGTINVHHLLTHTSGFRIDPIFFYPLTPKSPEHPDAPSLQLEVDRFGEVGATVPVGTTYSYSNAGYNTFSFLFSRTAQSHHLV